MEAKLVFDYFPDLTVAQRDQFNKLYPLYQEWNAQINVISRKDIDELYERHVLHSLAIGKFIQFLPGTHVLDVGTGGGFPGIPLAILFPEAHFHLVDSIAKKIKVVEAVADSIGLMNLTAEHNRAEKVEGQFDFVVSRAVARTKMIHSWTYKRIKSESRHSIENGWILLKGGDLDEELAEYGNQHRVVNLKDYFDSDFFKTKKIVYLPGMRKR